MLVNKCVDVIEWKKDHRYGVLLHAMSIEHEVIVIYVRFLADFRPAYTFNFVEFASKAINRSLDWIHSANPISRSASVAS